MYLSKYIFISLMSLIGRPCFYKRKKDLFNKVFFFQYYYPIHCCNIKMWLKNFSSQRMPCIPFNQVGTLWEASQEVGTASYIKLGFYIKTGLYLYCRRAQH